MTHVLFLTNGLGLGNSTRCHAIMQRLHEAGAHIEIVTSGNGLWYFADKPEVAVLHAAGSFVYGARDGEISVLRTFAGVGKMIRTLRNNAACLSRLLDERRPEVVVSDSEYTFMPVKRRGIPLVALNNADIVRQCYFAYADQPKSIAQQFYCVEQLDALYHRLIPDLVLSPALDPSLGPGRGRIRRIGPIVRMGYDPAPVAGTPTRVVVMLSGTVFGTPVKFEDESYPMTIDVIGREAPEGWTPRSDITFHGKIMDTYPLLRDADLAVVNGGFSAVSELFWMRKPMIVVPIPRHAEQWVNARSIVKLGVGRIGKEEDFVHTMVEMFSGLDAYHTAYRAILPPEDGARQAAEAIMTVAPRRKN